MMMSVISQSNYWFDLILINLIILHEIFREICLKMFGKIKVNMS